MYKLSNYLLPTAESELSDNSTRVSRHQSTWFIREMRLIALAFGGSLGNAFCARRSNWSSLSSAPSPLPHRLFAEYHSETNKVGLIVMPMLQGLPKWAVRTHRQSDRPRVGQQNIL